MKKFTDSSKMLSAKLKKYLKRAGIAVVVVAVGVATYITVSTDDSMVSSDSKLVSVATVEENSVSDTPVEYAKSEFEEMQAEKAEEKLSKVERSEKRAAALALAEDTEEVTEEATEADTENEEETEVTTTEIVLVPTEAPTTEKSTDGLPDEDIKQEATTREPKTTEATTSKSTDGLPDDEVKYDDDQGTYLGTYLLTAYCPCEICCGQWSNTENPVTASGNPAVEGVTIAAPSEFAFGTELVIDGHTYVVQDRGGAITGNHLDVYFSTHEKALNFAMGYYDVYMK
ncbi:MAG: 3D domain-containing protein [Coprococcus sp.]|nr:3D domain-containing protein [Coprococcus sp.]